MDKSSRRRLGTARWFGGLSLALTCFGLGAHAVAAQDNAPARGVIYGIVKDSSGARLAGATIVALATGVQAVSDDSGAFRLSGLPAGPLSLRIRRLGYAEAGVILRLVSAEAREVSVVLAESVRELDAMEVNAEAMRGKMSGFNTRRERGIGTFITRAQIEKRHPSKVSQLLRYVTGVYVPQDNSDMRPSNVGMRRAAGLSPQSSCAVQLYVDGQHYPDGRVDDFRPSEIEGIEIYKSASEIPANFRSRDTMCGVIALWTRDPSAVRRK